MTEPSQIKYTGGSTFTVLDKAAAQAQARGTYAAAGKLKGKSGAGENMVLDISEGTVRAIIVLSR